MTETYFFDTYAFFEVIYGNPKYKKFEDAEFLTTIFNLAELNLGLKRDFSEIVADYYLDIYWGNLIGVTIDDIKKATSLKRKYNKLSIPDAVGYTIAKRLHIKFLTGDEEFKNLENVEFIKK